MKLEKKIMTKYSNFWNEVPCHQSDSLDSESILAESGTNPNLNLPLT